MSKRVLIAGGGVAGIAALMHTAERGHRPLLLEASRRLGGRASSFDDPETGEAIDNCQHVATGACSAYLGLLGSIGVQRSQINWGARLTFCDAVAGEPRATRIAPSRVLPAPMQAVPDLLRAPFFDWREKRALALGALATVRARRDEQRGRVFSEWLEAHGQRGRVVDRFWRPVIVSACNAECDAVDAAVALRVFQEGAFGTRRQASIGVPLVPLRTLYDGVESAVRGLCAEPDVGVRTGARVAEIDAHSVTLVDGERLEGDAVICALPPVAAARALPDHHGDTRALRIGKLAHSPILGVHLTFDRPVLPDPRVLHAVLLDVGTQWVFKKDAAGCVLHAVVSAADDWMAMDQDAIAARVVDDLARVVPGAAGATLVRARAVKERRATFLATPEAESLRPSVAGPSGVFLAGDYVQTGWPATMESAARAGRAAGAAAIGELARPEPSARRPVLARLARFGA